MRTFKFLVYAFSLLAILCWTPTADAGISTEVKCALIKEKAAARFHTCRMTLLAKQTKDGVSPNFTKCDLALEKIWAKAESAAEKRGVNCNVIGPLEAVRSSIVQNASEVAALIDPDALSSCPENAFAYEGGCWFAGFGSCDAACAGEGLICDEDLTVQIAGSQGTNAHCSRILTELRSTPTDVSDVSGVAIGCGTPTFGLGCAHHDGEDGGRRYSTPLTNCSADGSGHTFCPQPFNLIRACACR